MRRYLHHLYPFSPAAVLVCAIGPIGRMHKISLSTCSPARGGAGSLRSSEMRSRIERVSQPRNLLSVGYSSGSPLRRQASACRYLPQLAPVEDVLKNPRYRFQTAKEQPLRGRWVSAANPEGEPRHLSADPPRTSHNHGRCATSRWMGSSHLARHVLVVPFVCPSNRCCSFELSE